MIEPQHIDPDTGDPCDPNDTGMYPPVDNAIATANNCCKEIVSYISNFVDRNITAVDYSTNSLFEQLLKKSDKGLVTANATLMLLHEDFQSYLTMMQSEIDQLISSVKIDVAPALANITSAISTSTTKIGDKIESAVKTATTEIANVIDQSVKNVENVLSHVQTVTNNYGPVSTTYGYVGPSGQPTVENIYNTTNTSQISNVSNVRQGDVYRAGDTFSSQQSFVNNVSNRAGDTYRAGDVINTRYSNDYTLNQYGEPLVQGGPGGDIKVSCPPTEVTVFPAGVNVTVESPAIEILAKDLQQTINILTGRQDINIGGTNVNVGAPIFRVLNQLGVNVGGQTVGPINISQIQGSLQQSLANAISVLGQGGETVSIVVQMIMDIIKVNLCRFSVPVMGEWAAACPDIYNVHGLFDARKLLDTDQGEDTPDGLSTPF